MTYPFGCLIRYDESVNALRKDAARNRDLVLQAAHAIRRGGQTLQLNAVARVAGVGVGTVYRHFATVEQLTEALVLGRFDDLTDRARQVQDAAGLRSFLEHALDILVSDDDFATTATTPRPALPATEEARQRLLDTLTAAIARSRPTRGLDDGLTPADILILLCGLAYAIRRSNADQARRRQYLDAFLRGTLT
ncbi:TetR/AcrR family transcriptional regulator [Microbacterium protaetiae]|nr:TetR/AcrR family transcriptional regulator [Microbacterium protaetiae]